MFSIVVFHGSALDLARTGRPSSLAFMPRSVFGGLPLEMFRDQARARAVAASASRSYGLSAPEPTARYAVYPSDAIDLSEANSCGDGVILRVSRPLFVPAGSEDLAGAHGWPADLLAHDADLSAYHAAAAFPVNLPAPVAPVDPVGAEAPSVSIRFEVRAGVQGTDRGAWACVHEAGDGKAAADWANANRALYRDGGKSLAIVKVEVDPSKVVDWRAREAARLASGEYLPLPSPFAERIADAYPDHFAHVAQGDKHKVAFTESEASGERDRQKVLSASEYAARFFSNYENRISPDRAVRKRFWYESERHEFAAAMLGASIKPLFAPLGDAEALARVYQDCSGGEAHGCMSGSSSNYSCGRDGFHPTAAYAQGGEITVALIRGYDEDDMPEGCSEGDIDPGATWDGEGPVLARCLVWDDSDNSGRMEYGRVYGQAHNARALRTALEAMGYSSGDLRGARIAKIPCPTYGAATFVMPYLDIGGGTVDDCGDHFTAGGDLSATRTDGLIYAREKVDCDRCGESTPEDDASPVYVGRHDSETWCSDCRDSDAFYCERSGEHVSDNNRADYVPSGGRWEVAVADWHLPGLALECADGVWREDAFECADCFEAFALDQRHDCAEDEDGAAVELCGECHREREELRDASEAGTAAAIAA